MADDRFSPGPEGCSSRARAPAGAAPRARGRGAVQAEGDVGARDARARSEEDALRRAIEHILDDVVANDAVVTRREDQLEQITSLVLLKLDSDFTARRDSGTVASFRARESDAATARGVRRAFSRFARAHTEVFWHAAERELRLTDESIARGVRLLAPLKLADSGVSALSTAFQVLRAAALKQGEGQYFTPQQVIEAGVKLLDIGWDDRVIDPACGTGGFLLEVLVEMQRRHPRAGPRLAEFARTALHGIEKDAIGVKLTRAMLEIAAGGSARCVRGDSVRTHLWPARYPALCGGDFEDGRFSVVITNPPFGANLKVCAEDCRRAKLDIARLGGQDYKDLEIGLVFLQRAHQLLAPGGRLGIVLPETYFFSEGYRFLFDWLKPRFRPRVVMNVPMVAFQGFCRAKTNFYVFEKIARPARGAIVFLNPASCGLKKDGGPSYRVDPDSGERSSALDNEMGEHAEQHRAKRSVPGSVAVPLERVFEKHVLVPRYYDQRWDAPFRELCQQHGWRATSVGALEEMGIVTVRGGHGSPSNEQRSGHVPYVKVSDIRSLRVNVNPTNLVSEAVARSFWRGPSSGLCAWDLVTPNRASANIGEFALLLPGEERIVLTKEVFVLRVTGGWERGWSPFYLLWALCLRPVRLEWQRITLMQTNREDVGRRYREILLPEPADEASAAAACAPLRDYFETIAEAGRRLHHALGRSGFDLIASASPGVRAPLGPAGDGS